MKKILIFTFIILSLVFAFASCGEDKAEKENPGTVVISEIENIDEWKIVRAENASDVLKKEISKFHMGIKKETGKLLSLSTDWNGAAKKEIIIGNTERKASATQAPLLRTDFDYIIKSEGNSIVIMGISDEGTISALNYFLDNLVKDGKVYYPKGDGIKFLKKTKNETISIGGVDISEFKLNYIEAPSGKGAQTTLDEVTAIRDRIADEQVGQQLEITNENHEYDHMIYFDRSGLDYEKGGIKVENGDLYIYGSYHSIGYVTDYLFETVMGEAKNVEIAADFSVELSTDDLPTIYSKDNLMDVLEYVYSTRDLLIVGDELDNGRAVPSVLMTKYMEATGTHPAIMGLDLGRCGYKMPTLRDDQWMIISQMICESIDYAGKGGIITIGNHMTNPNPHNIPEGESEDRGDFGTEKDWVALITEGTPQNERFKSELELNAIVFKAFEDAGVPIIWRPFHECNGGWFWWTPELSGEKFDAKYFVDMWKYVYDFFTVEKGLTNLLWEYSPSTSTHIDLMELYPGDEYCDMVGIDWYTAGKFEIGENDGYKRLMETGKVTNLAEFGIGDSLMAETKEEQERLYDAEKFIGNAYSMYYEDMNIGYLMTYAGQTGLLWLPGGDKVMQDERVLELKEMPALFEKVTDFKAG